MEDEDRGGGGEGGEPGGEHPAGVQPGVGQRRQGEQVAESAEEDDEADVGDQEGGVGPGLPGQAVGLAAIQG